MAARSSSVTLTTWAPGGMGLPSLSAPSFSIPRCCKSASGFSASVWAIAGFWIPSCWIKYWSKAGLRLICSRSCWSWELSRSASGLGRGPGPETPACCCCCANYWIDNVSEKEKKVGKNIEWTWNKFWGWFVIDVTSGAGVWIVELTAGEGTSASACAGNPLKNSKSK